MVSHRPTPPDGQLAHAVRERFVAEVEGVLIEMAATAQGRLGLLAEQVSSAREMQEYRDALNLFTKLRGIWVENARQAWCRALQEPPAPRVAPAQPVPSGGAALTLVGNDEVENRIVASRLTLAVLDKVTWELNDLRLRIQRLQNIPELPPGDVFKPDTLSVILVDQWTAAGLTLAIWRLVVDQVQPLLVDRLVSAYHHANEFLVRSGVMPEIDLKPLVRRAGGVAGRAAAPTAPRERAPERADGEAAGGGDGGDAAGGGSGPGGDAGGSGGGGSAGGTLRGGLRSLFGRGGGGAAGSSAYAPSSMADGDPGRLRTGMADETRMLTAVTPLARARQRAQGVLGQLRRFIGERVGDFEQTRRATPSPELAQALDPALAGTALLPVDQVPHDAVGVGQLSVELRERSNELKRKAATPAEKATIEIVALMFQAILAEERIPAAIRVWFARLQMPVLRVAMAEPEFFGTLQHPARQLIDRMGGCVMGFDAAEVEGGALEAEIRRVVQVIEQYPETGRKVFQLVLDEFQNFLKRYLTEKDSVQKMVSVAQQVEQKETLTIQYTIEFRDMLASLRVRDEVREFLFKVWAEVLAVAAVKHGAQHADTLALKRAATELVWAASAKPNREDRARVIHDLPGLLQRLRQGMSLLGLPASRQDMHIKTLGDALADAFMSRTEAIEQHEIETLARRLANLEAAVMDQTTGDIPLDADSVEMMLGVDASSFVVLADGGSRPGEAMLAWVQELALGEWFMLDHNGQMTQVQLVWRSDRKQLHLFTSADGRNYLIQARRLAAYLQAGLLVPAEEEALTVRATRKALAKLDANPERLLH